VRKNLSHAPQIMVVDGKKRAKVVNSGYAAHKSGKFSTCILDLQ